MVVAKYLMDRGVERDQVRVRYFGESRPIADNGTEEGRARNRRVEMKIVEKEE